MRVLSVFMAQKKSPPKQEVFYLEINPEIKRKGFLQESELYKEREVLQKYVARKYAKISVLYLFFAFLIFRLVVFVEFLIAGLRIKTSIWEHLFSDLSFLLFYIILAIPIYVSVYLFTIRLVQEGTRSKVPTLILNLAISAVLFLPFYFGMKRKAVGVDYTDLFFIIVILFEILYVFISSTIISKQREVKVWEE